MLLGTVFLSMVSCAVATHPSSGIDENRENRLFFSLFKKKAKRAELVDFEMCGVLNAPTSDEDEVLTSQCWAGCQWEKNELENELWQFSDYYPGNPYYYPVISIEPRVPDRFNVSCLAEKCIPAMVVHVVDLWNQFSSVEWSIDDVCSDYLFTGAELPEVLLGQYTHCLTSEIKFLHFGENAPYNTTWISTAQVEQIQHMTMLISLLHNFVKQHLPDPYLELAKKTKNLKKNKNRQFFLDEEKIFDQARIIVEAIEKYGNSSGVRNPADSNRDDQKRISAAHLETPVQKERMFSPSMNKVKSSSAKRYPWVCSLRVQGMRPHHKCGVTLLSGPPNATILVSSAHCNYVCKDGSNLVESCCCTDPDQVPSSCRQQEKNKCGNNPKLRMAAPQDFQIVCGAESTFLQPETDDKVFLPVEKIINHPKFKPGTGDDSDDFLDGYDLSVYIVDDAMLKSSSSNKTKFSPTNIWPACLPKLDAEYGGDRGILSGFLGPPATILADVSHFFEYFAMREVNVQLQETCADKDERPDYYYPEKTKCYRDPTSFSCIDFGMTGSGVVRQADGNDGYSFMGPVSFTRGCDKTIQYEEKSVLVTSMKGENPMVVTDIRCHMEWIAEQYDMKMPDSYEMPESCKESGSGDREYAPDASCDAHLLNFGVSKQSEPSFPCDWQLTRNITGTMGNECSLDHSGSYPFNYHVCYYKNVNGEAEKVRCDTNCPGVDTPNAVIVGG